MPEEIVSEEMIEISKVVAIDQNLVPIILIMRVLKEKLQVEIIIMPQN
jgi:hypothetical protein